MSTASSGASEPASRRQNRDTGPRRATSRERGERSTSPRPERTLRWYGIASILVPLVVFPFSLFIWFQMIQLGSYPGGHAVADLVVAILLTALVHALLVGGILLGVLQIRGRRAAKKPAILGWVGIVIAAAVIVFWELLVSPWLVEYWRLATAS